MLQQEDVVTGIYPRVLRSGTPVTLDPLQLAPEQVTAEFEEDLVDRQELIETLSQGAVLHPAPEMPQATTFSIDGTTKNFWVKLFYSSMSPGRVERVHIIGVSRRGSEIKHVDVD
jgi:hypothetical protein